MKTVFKYNLILTALIFLTLTSSTWAWSGGGNPISSQAQGSSTEGSYSYDTNYSNITAFSSTTVQSYIFVFATTGTPVYFQASDAAGNPVTDNIDIDIYQSEPAEDTVYYYWNFDDGTPVVRDNHPVHVFESTGMYSVTVTAKDLALYYDDPDYSYQISVEVLEGH